MTPWLAAAAASCPPPLYKAFLAKINEDIMASKPEQNRRDVAAARARDTEAGIVRVEVRVPADDKDSIMAIAAQMRARTWTPPGQKNR